MVGHIDEGKVRTRKSELSEGAGYGAWSSGLLAAKIGVRETKEIHGTAPMAGGSHQRD